MTGRLTEAHRKVIEAAVEFYYCYGSIEQEGDTDIMEAVDELLEAEPGWNPAGVRDHVR